MPVNALRGTVCRPSLVSHQSPHRLRPLPQYRAETAPSQLSCLNKGIWTGEKGSGGSTLTNPPTKKRKKQAATLNNAFLRTTACRGDRSSRVRGRGPAPNNTLIENLTANTTLNFPGTRVRFETSPPVCRRQQSQFAASFSEDFCLDGSAPFCKVNHTHSVLEGSPS